MTRFRLWVVYDPITIAETLTSVAVIAVAVCAAGFLLVWAVLRAARYTPSAMLSVLVGLLTLVAMGIFAVTASEVMGTLAATGLGALSASLASLFQDRRRREPEKGAQPPADPPDASP